MTSPTDQEIPPITVVSFDCRSAAFRQKMLTHYQSNGRKPETNIEEIAGKKRNDAVMLLKKIA